jgi:cytochrome c553
MKIPAKTRTLGILLAFVAVSAFAQQSARSGDKPGEKTGAAPAALSMCVGCHGIPMYQTAFPEVYRVPKIAGQSQQYIVSALKAYKSGDRNHPSMRGIAATLSDQDMAALAAYYGAPFEDPKKSTEAAKK